MFIMNLCSQGSVVRVRWVILGTFVFAILLTSAEAAFAQAAPAVPPGVRMQQTATVTTEAPVFLLPDATRKPLRMLAPGTSLVVQRVQDDWLQVSFNDPQFGRRTGWIQQQFVKVSAAQPVPPEPVPPPAEARGAGASAAQSPSTTDRGGLGLRGFGTVTFDKMAASESFKAVTEKDTATFFGGGVQVTNLWQGLFVEVAAERSSLDGERVFVGPDDEVFRLGIPVSIKMTPVDVVAGWRSAPVNRASGYGAAGVSFLKYEETSDFADADENVDERYTGLVLLGGIEYSAARFVHIRGEVRYRRFADAIGAGGASAAFDETDLGSFGAALKIAVGR
jgi:opacity protein-like surface antigen